MRIHPGKVQTRAVRLCAIVALLVFASGSSGGANADESFVLAEDDGYRGIWYAVGETKDQYAFKYSGGMATYPQQHAPIACYSAAANKTFFVYGGAPRGKRQLLHMVSYFDHATKSVPRPRVLLNKQTNDAHDNPTLALDEQGYLWIFSNSHGTSRPSFIHRSTEPYSIASFRQVLTTNFSYSQPWSLGRAGFLVLHTRYKSGRGLFWMTSPDGFDWSEPQSLAHFAQGHYQVSWVHEGRVATGFNYHPRRGGLDARTNLYFLQTSDGGKTWQTAEGQTVATPLTEVRNPALVRDYESQGLLVYLKEVRFDSQGRPLILFVTSRGHEPGPANDPRTWRLACWNGKSWEIRDITTSDHNYDFGTFDVASQDDWRLIAPTDAGPQPYGTGGQMVLWKSGDQGRTWRRDKPLTGDAERNHSYARGPLNSHADFSAIWADGNAREASDSSLYFTDRAATHVWRLPGRMNGETAQPEVAW